MPAESNQSVRRGPFSKNSVALPGNQAVELSTSKDEPTTESAETADEWFARMKVMLGEKPRGPALGHVKIKVSDARFWWMGELMEDLDRSRREKIERSFRKHSRRDVRPMIVEVHRQWVDPGCLSPANTAYDQLQQLRWTDAAPAEDRSVCVLSGRHRASFLVREVRDAKWTIRVLEQQVSRAGDAAPKKILKRAREGIASARRRLIESSEYRAVLYESL